MLLKPKLFKLSREFSEPPAGRCLIISVFLSFQLKGHIYKIAAC